VYFRDESGRAAERRFGPYQQVRVQGVVVSALRADGGQEKLAVWLEDGADFLVPSQPVAETEPFPHTQMTVYTAMDLV
jgi:hypothetical protein